MSDIEIEMNKYASLIKNECSIISNTFQKLSNLYKEMNDYLKKKEKILMNMKRKIYLIIILKKKKN